MMRRFCDRCGVEMEGSGRLVLSMIVSPPHKQPETTYDKDLCPSCFEEMSEAIKATVAKFESKPSLP
jgi:ribosomal protein L34E